MKVSTVVFACYSKVCAPPPAGKGGSLKGARAAARANIRSRDAYKKMSPEARSRIDSRSKAKTAHKKVDNSFYERALSEALKGSKSK